MSPLRNAELTHLQAEQRLARPAVLGRPADADRQALKATAPKPHTNVTAEIRQRLGPGAGPLTSLNRNGLTAGRRW